MKRIVFTPLAARLAAVAMTRRKSATLLSTPLSRSKRDSVALAMISARLVLPVPGGPKRMIEEMRSASMARRSSFPGARMCSCPVYSSSVRGRIRWASGAADVEVAAAVSAGSDAKRSDMLPQHTRNPWPQRKQNGEDDLCPPPLAEKCLEHGGAFIMPDAAGQIAPVIELGV